MPNRNRWCLSAVFVAPFPVDAERLRETVRSIIARHDALRIRWDVDQDGSLQCVGAAVPGDVLVVAGDARSDHVRFDAEDRLADRLRDTLALETGHMLAVGAIRHTGKGATHIVVAVHHA